MMNIKDSTKY